MTTETQNELSVDAVNGDIIATDLTAEQATALNGREAGVNFDRIDANALIRLTKKYTEDYCEDAADRKYPNRSLY